MSSNSEICEALSSNSLPIEGGTTEELVETGLKLVVASPLLPSSSVL